MVCGYLRKMRRSARIASSSSKKLAVATSVETKQGIAEAPVSSIMQKKRAKCSSRSSRDSVNEPEGRMKKSKGTKRARENSATDAKRRDAMKVEPEHSKSRTKIKTEVEIDAAGIATEKFVGAHVSISGGIHKAVTEALAIGAKSFALFLRSQRQWNSKPLDDNAAILFRDACEKAGFAANTILPHGIYLMNCGSPNEETLSKSRNTLIEELQRCEKLGLCLYNFHPGSTCGEISIAECLDRIAESINQAHRKTKFVITVIENMSCQGNTVGGKFEELRGIIDRVEDKSRVGVCLDTCHAFAAGYDLATDEGFTQMTEEFDRVVGFNYLKAMHLNDSKGERGCHLDRHENIGLGKIGLQGFRRVMQEPRFSGIPLILETPCVSDSTYSKEIKLLNSMLS